MFEHYLVELGEFLGMYCYIQIMMLSSKLFSFVLIEIQ
jgi:hypothetical protein